MLPCISAAGDVGPTLINFQSKRVPYREVLVDGQVYLEGLGTYLPRGCLLKMRKEVASIDGDSFYQFAQAFAAHVKDLTTDGRKILLTFNACRSHMTLRTLEHLLDHNVVVYALPAHTSGKIQPLEHSRFVCALDCGSLTTRV